MLDSQGGALLSSVLVHSGTLVCMDAARTVRRGDVLVLDGTIAALGDVTEALAALPGGKPAHKIDASGALVLPGFVQGHLHLCQTLFRGMAEQADLLRWLREAIWPLEAAHTAASVAASARLALCELIASGVTCINDMGTVRHTEATGAVLEESGIRAVFGKALMDRGEGVPAGLIEPAQAALDDALALAKRFDGAAGGRLRVSLAPRFILSCSDTLWDGVAAASASRGLLVHTHLAESPSEGREVAAAIGRTAARHFAAHGVLSRHFVGAHGVWLDDEELKLVKDADAALVHCPGSNLKLGSGIAAVAAWRRAGVRCGIGCDGAACNNHLDAFQEMSLAGLVSRVRDAASPLAPQDVLALATCDGARALGLESVAGTLAAGRPADLVLVDVSGPHHAPLAETDPYTTLVHGARASDVRLTMVAGRVLYHDGRWTTLDPRAAVAEARAEARALAKRAGMEKAA